MTSPGTVIIIGASSGIGYESARIFASLGWKTGVMARREEPLRELASDFPGKIEFRTTDITSENSVRDILSFIEELGKTDIVFLTAGTGWANPSLNLEKDLMTVKTDVEGFVRVVDTAYGYFRQHNPHGQIAAISSVAGTKGIGISASYSASKSFNSKYLEALSQLSAIDGLHIAVTDIRPGFIRTALLDPSRSYPLLMKPEKAARQIVKAILKRKKIAVIDTRWKIVVAFWRMIPGWLWRKMKIKL